MNSLFEKKKSEHELYLGHLTHSMSSQKEKSDFDGQSSKFRRVPCNYSSEISRRL
ncbi:UNVERIFIED_CONTAM: hypothetical protein FKN15_045196 [Acipenser sinensis]